MLSVFENKKLELSYVMKAIMNQFPICELK